MKQVEHDVTQERTAVLLAGLVAVLALAGAFQAHDPGESPRRADHTAVAPVLREPRVDQQAPPPSVSAAATPLLTPVFENPVRWIIKAKVRRGDGQPVEGAQLVLTPQSPEEAGGRASLVEALAASMKPATALSDDNGNIQLELNAPRFAGSVLRLELSKPGHMTRRAYSNSWSSTVIDLGVVTLEPVPSVAGRVVDEFGSGIPDVVVRITHQDHSFLGWRYFDQLQVVATHATLTDRSGAFRLPAPAPGPARLTVTGARSKASIEVDVPVLLEPLPLDTNVVVADIELTTIPMWTSTIRVVDAERQPIADATVERRVPRREFRGDHVALKTDANGIVVVEGWGPHRSPSHRVVAAGFEHATVVTPRDNDEIIEVSLTRADHREIEVTDSVSGERVVVDELIVWLDADKQRRAQGPPRASDRLEAYVDPDDRARWMVFGAPDKPEECSVFIRAEGFVDSWLPWPAPSDGVAVLSIAPATALTVTVLDPDGHALPGATVTVSTSPGRVTSLTGASGRAVVDGMPAGTLRIRASAWPYSSEDLSLCSNPGDQLECVMPLHRASHLVVHVLDDTKESAAGTTRPFHDGLELERLGGGLEGYLVSGLVEVAAGRFEAHDIAEGTYRATWEPGGVTEFDIRDGERTEAWLSVRSWPVVQGVVTLDGVPLEGAQISVDLHCPELEGGFVLGCGTGLKLITIPLSVVTDAAGYWHLQGLIEDAWEISVLAGETVQRTHVIQVEYDQVYWLDTDLQTLPTDHR